MDARTLDAAESALRAAGAQVETRLTESIDELAALLEERAGGRVALLGGDGTLHAVANLCSSLPELALLAAGRANNIARSLDIPVNLTDAAKLAVEGNVRPVDVIKVEAGERRQTVVEGLSIGLHAVARALYRAPNSACGSCGVRAGLHAARTFHGVTVHIETDGASDELDVGQLFVVNLPRFGFGLNVAPQAKPDDGVFHLVTLPPAGRRALPVATFLRLQGLMRLRHGTHLGRGGVRAWRARSAYIEIRGESPVIADTTNLGGGPVSLKVSAGALRMVAP